MAAAGDGDVGPAEVEEKEAQAEQESCGICLAEAADMVRGRLDCCAHTFCFACIMAWARVESRCPFCKRRFEVVRREENGGRGRGGRLAYPRAFRIPQRDQRYEPTPEDVQEALAPYDNTACTECGGTTEEALLLLCDRCDSAAHTFCLGLGRRVPRGEWICPTCTAVEASLGLDDSQEANDRRATRAVRRRRQQSARRSSAVDAVDASFFVSDREDDECNWGLEDEEFTVDAQVLAELVAGGESAVVTRSQRRLASARQGSGDAPRSTRRASSDIADGQLRSVDRATGAHTQRQRRPVRRGLGSRTVGGQRHVVSRIQHLRNNWESLRSGAMTFRDRDYSQGPVTAARPAASAAARQGVQDSTPGASQPNQQADQEQAQAWELLRVARSLGEHSRAGQLPPSEARRRSGSPAVNSNGQQEKVAAQHRQTTSTNLSQRGTERVKGQTTSELAHRRPDRHKLDWDGSGGAIKKRRVIEQEGVPRAAGLRESLPLQQVQGQLQPLLRGESSAQGQWSNEDKEHYARESGAVQAMDDRLPSAVPASVDARMGPLVVLDKQQRGTNSPVPESGGIPLHLGPEESLLPPIKSPSNTGDTRTKNTTKAAANTQPPLPHSIEAPSQLPIGRSGEMKGGEGSVPGKGKAQGLIDIDSRVHSEPKDDSKGKQLRHPYEQKQRESAIGAPRQEHGREKKRDPKDDGDPINPRKPEIPNTPKSAMEERRKMKEEVSEKVRRSLKPWFQAGVLDREHFKVIAKGATHALADAIPSSLCPHSKADAAPGTFCKRCIHSQVLQVAERVLGAPLPPVQSAAAARAKV